MVALKRTYIYLSRSSISLVRGTEVSRLQWTRLHLRTSFLPLCSYFTSDNYMVTYFISSSIKWDIAGQSPWSCSWPQHWMTLNVTQLRDRSFHFCKALQNHWRGVSHRGRWWRVRMRMIASLSHSRRRRRSLLIREMRRFRQIVRIWRRRWRERVWIVRQLCARRLCIPLIPATMRSSPAMPTNYRLHVRWCGCWWWRHSGTVMSMWRRGRRWN